MENLVVIRLRLNLKGVTRIGRSLPSNLSDTNGDGPAADLKRPEPQEVPLL